MSRASLTIVTFSLTLIAAAGCKDKGGGGSAGPVKLPTLGLVIEVPGEVDVSDAVMGKGHMLLGSGVGSMQVEIADAEQALDEAKSDADMFTPKELKAETLPDGWALTFENKGSMGANFFVDVRRKLGGKLIKCWTTGSDKSQAAAVLAACKGLKQG